MPSKIQEILDRSTEELAKLSDAELQSLLSDLLPASRKIDATSPEKQNMANDLVKQLERMMKNTWMLLRNGIKDICKRFARLILEQTTMQST